MTAGNAPQQLSSDEFQQLLLARLGLPASASSEDIDAAHRAVTSYLAHAPRELKTWARRQAAEADETYAILIDPTALADPAALVGQAARPAVAPGGPATPPARRETLSSPAADATVAAVMTEDATDDVAEPTFDEMLAAVTPDAHRDSIPAAKKPTTKPVTPKTGPAGGRLPFRRLAIVGVAVVAVAVVAIVGYDFGGSASGSTGTPSPSAAAAASPTLDQAAVAALMQKLQADPNDTTTLQSLADQYYAVGDYATAGDFLDKLLAVDPTNINGLLAHGAVAFNQGDYGNAKTDWLKVVSIDDKNVEAHYDLGFLYLNQQPADMAGVQAEWGKVVTLAPDSDVAKTVQAHLTALASAAPSAAPEGSSSPAASPSPAASGTAQP
jgi:cytochrome c-type biogenesis protein CcmH/NrfG